MGPACYATRSGVDLLSRPQLPVPAHLGRARRPALASLTAVSRSRGVRQTGPKQVRTSAHFLMRRADGWQLAELVPFRFATSSDELSAHRRVERECLAANAATSKNGARTSDRRGRSPPC